jgi:Sugar (and other) transporter
MTAPEVCVEQPGLPCCLAPCGFGSPNARCRCVLLPGPAYIAETAPSSVRGLLISLKEAFIVGGILLGYLASYVWVDEVGGWRLMYGSAALPALALGLGMVRAWHVACACMCPGRVVWGGWGAGYGWGIVREWTVFLPEIRRGMAPSKFVRVWSLKDSRCLLMLHGQCSDQLKRPAAACEWTP